MKKPEEIDQRTPEQKHQKQLWLEVFLPLILTIALCAGLAILSVVLTGSNGILVAQWADISIILMIVPLFLFCLVIFVALIYIDRALIHWNKSIPDFFTQARLLVDSVAAKLQNLFTLLAAPIIFIKSALAAIEHLAQQIFPINK